MPRLLRRQRSSASLVQPTDLGIRNGIGSRSAPPTPPSNPSRSSSPSKRLSCAFQALRCSSRAAEDGKFSDPENVSGGFPTETDFLQERNFFMGSQLLPPPLNHNSRCRSSETSVGYESDSSASVLLELSSVGDEHEPFEDQDHDQVGSPNSPLTPSSHQHRTALDPPETPNVSNRDVSRPPVELKATAVATPDSAFDELCQRNFNTTPKMLLQKGSLGDDITPLASPEHPSSGESDCSIIQRTVSHAQVSRQLEIPSMYNTGQPPLRHQAHARSSVAIDASSVSQDYKEFYSAERKSVKQDNLRTQKWEATFVDDDTSEGNSKAEPPQIPTPKEDKDPKPEDSSFSSVSSFVEISVERGESKPKQQDLSSRPPFFWRSHPSVTVYSYDFQQPSKTHFRSADNEQDHFYSNYTSFPTSRRSNAGLDQDIIEDILLSRNTAQSFKNPTAVLQTLAHFAAKKLPGLFAWSDK